MNKSLRRIGLTISSTVLWISLLSLAISGVMAQTVRNKETVKTWLDKSGFYEELAEGILEQIKEDGAKGLVSEVDLNNPDVNRVVDQAFSPELVKEITDNVVDGTYDWLEGKVDEPEYQVSLVDSKKKLAEGLGAYAAQRVSGLPACSGIQLQQAIRTGFNPLTATCQPPGVSSSQIRQQVEQEVSSGLGFLPDNFNNEDNPINSEENVLPESFRSAYQASDQVYAFFIVGILVGSAGVIYLSSTRKKGLFRAGMIYFVSGAVIGFGAYLLGAGPDRITKLIEESSEGQTGSDVLARLVVIAGQDASRLLWWYAGVFVVIGLIILIVTKVYFSNKNTEDRKNDTPVGPVPPIDDSPKIQQPSTVKLSEEDELQSNKNNPEEPTKTQF